MIEVERLEKHYGSFVAGGVPPPGRTEMDLYTLAMELIYAYNEWWTLDAFYRYTSYQSDSSFFDSSRTIVGIGLRRDF